MEQIVMNEENNKKINVLIYKRLHASELLEQGISFEFWNKNQLTDYIYFLDDMLTEAEENME